MKSLTLGLMSEAIRTAWGMPKRSSAWLSDSHPLQCEITSNGLPSAKMWLRCFAADAAALALGDAAHAAALALGGAAALALGDAAGAAARFPFAVIARVGTEARDR